MRSKAIAAIDSRLDVVRRWSEEFLRRVPLLAIARIGVALMWIQNASWKKPPHFGSDGATNPATCGEHSGLYRFTSSAVDCPVFAPYAWLVDNLVLPAFSVFGWGVLIAEVALGALLLIGLATRLIALIGVLQSGAITLSALNVEHEWHWAYFLMVLVHLALIGGDAGRRFGLDGVLRPTTGSVTRATLGRAAITIAVGGAAAATLLFFFLSGPLRFARMDGVALVLTLVLAALALVAGATGRAPAALVAGGGFVAVAVTQVVMVVVRNNPIGGNLSTSALWFGLGIGLLAIGFAMRRTGSSSR